MGSIIVPRSLRRAFLFPGGRKPCNIFGTCQKSVKYYSDIATKPDTVSDNSAIGERKLDPFGIEDISDNNSNLLVQGFYERNLDDNKPKDVQTPKDTASEKTDSPNAKKYEGWLHARAVANVREKTLLGAETFRISSFGGTMRLDSDNIVEEHGQFDEHVNAQRSQSNLDKRRRREKENYGPDPKSMLAGDFVKKFKQETSEEIKNSKRQSVVIDKPQRRSELKPDLQTEQEKFVKVWGPDGIDSNHVPKIYQLPLYNKLTQDEMWRTLLKRTVIFQNEYIFAINKPSGVPIHSPSLDCRHYITQFLSRFAKLANVENIFPLHRLDKETSGVLLFAKDARIAKYITEKFGQRQIEKKYLAVTKSCPQVEDGTINIPIGQGKIGPTTKYRSVLKPDLREYDIHTKQKQCREAITHFKVLNSIKEAAFVEVRIETGVQHQIRIHFGLGLGCPIIGDHKYSHRDRMAPQRLHPHLLHMIKVRQSKVRELPLHLHCNSISFALPDGASDSSEPVYVHAHVPAFFNHTLRAIGLKK